MWQYTCQSNDAGVLRQAQRGRKPPMEQEGRSSLDLDFQVQIQTVKAGPHYPFKKKKNFNLKKLPLGGRRGVVVVLNDYLIWGNYIFFSTK